MTTDTNQMKSTSSNTESVNTPWPKRPPCADCAHGFYFHDKTVTAEAKALHPSGELCFGWCVDTDGWCLCAGYVPLDADAEVRA